MYKKKRSKVNTILIYTTVILLAANLIFIGALLFKGDRNVELVTSSSATETPTLAPTVNLTNTSPARLKIPIRLAWFTSLPKSVEDIETVANWFDFFILIQGDEKHRDLVKSLGADGPFLQYLEFETIQDPGSCSAEPKINQVTDKIGDFCRISNDHPDWFLLDKNGKRIKVTDSDNVWYVMDPGNAGWRGFFLERVQEFQSDPNWDGVFLDNVPTSLVSREDDESLPSAYPDDTSYQEAVQGFLQFLYNGYFQPTHKLLIANFVSRRDNASWIEQLNYVDGAMFEGWAIDWPDGYRSANVWEAQMKVAEQTQQYGKDIILVSQGTKEDVNLQNFAFASYLLINLGKAAFRYANSSHYREIWLYDNYSVDLGAPLGLRYKIGNEWRRDFTNGYVKVNPVTHTAEIKIK